MLTEKCTLCTGRGYTCGRRPFTHKARINTCSRCGGSGELPEGAYNRNPWGRDAQGRTTRFGRPVTDEHGRPL